MQFYSQYPRARARQIVADSLAVLAVAAFVALGIAAGTLIGGLAALGRGIEDAGTGFEGTMSDAASALGGIPLIGSGAASPFRSASSVGAGLAASGQQQQQLVGNAALAVGLAVAVLPIILILLVWLRPRLGFARRAAAARTLAASPGGLDLLALRALTSQSPRALLAVSDAPVAAWRAADPRVLRMLADLELARAGLQPQQIRPRPRPTVE